VLVETSLPDDEVEQRASRIGLSDVLLTGADPVNLLAKVAPDLWYLPAGAQLAEAREHMVAPTLRKVVDRLRSSERMVVLVGPRTSSPEGAAVVAVCDRAVLCVTPGASTFHDVEQAREALAMVHTDLLGSVLTQPVKGRADRQASDRDGDGFIGSVFNDESPDDRDRHQP
jgi:Mrp family chromosome partitioning ATPase